MQTQFDESPIVRLRCPSILNQSQSSRRSNPFAYDTHSTCSEFDPGHVVSLFLDPGDVALLQPIDKVRFQFARYRSDRIRPRSLEESIEVTLITFVPSDSEFTPFELPGTIQNLGQFERFPSR